MMKKVAGAAGALLVFVLGTMLLVNYVRDAEQRVVANEQPVDVLVVSQPVAAGESAVVRSEPVPRRLVVDDAVLAVDSLSGLVAAVDLVPGEQLLWSRLSTPDDVVATDRTRLEIPSGYLSVTVPVNAERAIGGLLTPGMRVGVVGSFEVELALEGSDESTVTQATNILVHKALVIEVQSDNPAPTEPPSGAGAAPLPSGRFLVTLAVPAYDIERIVFAAEWGSIWLAEENLDADESGSRIQTPDTIFIDPSPDDDTSDRLSDSVASIAPRVRTGSASTTDADAPEPASVQPASTGQGDAADAEDSQSTEGAGQ